MRGNWRVSQIVMAVIAAAFVTSGCVSTGKYDQLEADKKQAEANMNQEIAKLQKENATLQLQLKGSEREKAAIIEATRRNQRQYDALVRKLSTEVKQGQLKVRQYQNMLTVDAADQIFFDSGRAELKASGKELLKKLGEELKGYDQKVIRVVGHTDNVPVAKAMQSVYPSNWELSVARATSVVRYLQEVGVPPERMVASGRGEFEPLAPNDSAEGRQMNRRIEIMLIDQALVNELSKPRS